MNRTRANFAAPAASRPASAMPDVTRSLPWRDWTAGCEEAKRRKVPIFAFAEPRWSNSAQRLAHVIGEDDRLRDALQDRVVPVLVDPVVRPDLAARWRWSAVALTSTSGPPLAMLLTHEGAPVLSYPGMQYEGDDLMPSLASLVTATTEAYAENTTAFVDEALSLDRRGTDTSSEFETFMELWTALKPELDMAQGGLREVPRHPHPQLLWGALDAVASGESEDAADWVGTTLRHMIDGGVNDHLDRGFHRCSRDNRWVVPHFEKPVPLNAQLAAVYARVGHELEQNAFTDMARDLATFCTTALQERVECVGSNSAYYTWTSKELLDGLNVDEVQPVSLHFGIGPSPLRQAVHRAVPIDRLDQYSRENLEVLQARVERGRKHMLKLRQQRPAPELVAMPGYSWRGETLRWLFIASDWLPGLDVGQMEAMLAATLETGVDPERGYVRAGDDDAWLEDQAALLGAMVAAAARANSGQWHQRARELADIVVRAYRTEDGWRDRAGDDATSMALVDDILPAAIPALTAALLALDGPDSGYAGIARAQAAPYRSAASIIGARGAVFWRTWEMTAS